MSLFPRRTVPGEVVIVHVRLRRQSGSVAPWAVHASLAGPDGRERAQFAAGADTMAPGAGQLDRWFPWQSSPEDPLGRYHAKLIAAVGEVVVGSSTEADDHFYLERLERSPRGLRNPGPEPVPARLLSEDGSVIDQVEVPPSSIIELPKAAAFASWADGRVLALSSIGARLRTWSGQYSIS